VACLEGATFAEAQPQGVDGGECHAADGVAHRAEERANLGGTEHDGERTRLVDAEHLEDLPLPIHGVDEEEAHRVDRDVDAGGRELLRLAEVEKVGTDVVVRDRGGDFLTQSMNWRTAAM
jgi:hypothetical protein